MNVPPVSLLEKLCLFRGSISSLNSIYLELATLGTDIVPINITSAITNETQKWRALDNFPKVISTDRVTLKKELEIILPTMQRELDLVFTKLCTDIAATVIAGTVQPRKDDLMAQIQELAGSVVSYIPATDAKVTIEKFCGSLSGDFYDYSSDIKLIDRVRDSHLYSLARNMFSANMNNLVQTLEAPILPDLSNLAPVLAPAQTHTFIDQGSVGHYISVLAVANNLYNPTRNSMSAINLGNYAGAILPWFTAPTDIVLRLTCSSNITTIDGVAANAVVNPVVCNPVAATLAIGGVVYPLLAQGATQSYFVAAGQGVSMGIEQHANPSVAKVVINDIVVVGDWFDGLKITDMVNVVPANQNSMFRNGLLASLLTRKLIPAFRLARKYSNHLVNDKGLQAPSASVIAQLATLGLVGVTENIVYNPGFWLNRVVLAGQTPAISAIFLKWMNKLAVISNLALMDPVFIRDQYLD